MDRNHTNCSARKVIQIKKINWLKSTLSPVVINIECNDFLPFQNIFKIEINLSFRYTYWISIYDKLEIQVMIL